MGEFRWFSPALHIKVTVKCKILLLKESLNNQLPEVYNILIRNTRMILGFPLVSSIGNFKQHDSNFYSYNGV